MGITSSVATPVCHKIGIAHKSEAGNHASKKLAATIREFLQIQVEAVKIIKAYYIFKPFSEQQLFAIAHGPLIDPLLEENVFLEDLYKDYNWIIEIALKPGITNTSADTAKTTIEDFTGLLFGEDEDVYTATQYLLQGALSDSEVHKIAHDLLGNSLIEDIHIQKITSHSSHPIILTNRRHPKRSGSIREKSHNAEVIDIQLPDHALMELSKQRQLALNLAEMQTIRDYYSLQTTAQSRARYGLPSNPTDVELEAIAQTWSEHCKHKIFNAKITYTEDGKTEEIDSLFKTYIQKATEELSKKVDWLVSVFTDNAGIIRFNKNYNLAVKVETHNSPSALDPYGGALTGILGVNRDILGAGLGARLIANTDVFCFAPPNYKKSLYKRLMHPKRIFEGVRKGVEHGGNKSGIPTVNGAIVFDEGYLGKPLVYCGSVGLMPSTIGGASTHLKVIHPGDLIVIAGGRTGKDGIHGATFSSEEFHAGSPLSAVQIGDPFTQKKMQDFLLEARDQNLYRAITDNGAGGFSSSVGELAQLSDGCKIHLDKALLKHPQILPWEILLSESQERMTLAAAPENLEQLQALADLHEVELCVLGLFTGDGNFHVLFNEKTVALLPLHFLHGGLPQQRLQAEWKTPKMQELRLEQKRDYGPDLHALLSSYNICSKERIIRQYDHEVQGGTVLKPLTGIYQDAPSDAAILFPTEFWEETEKAGIGISNGICPRYSSLDTYHMTANALDEAIRNLVASGCDPSSISILDNFCWPDPIYDEHKTPDGKYKLAQLVRAVKSLYFFSKEFETPIISGKDSMKNDYKMDAIKISIPPTLLITAIGKVHSLEKIVSTDVKVAGDWVYIIGATKNECGGSEYASIKGLKGGNVPKVEAKKAKKSYQALHQAMELNLVSSCHDCSEGGIAVALAEKAFGGDLGISVDLSLIPVEDPISEGEILFSESASRLLVTANPLKKKAFEDCMRNCICQRIGEVTPHKYLKIKGLNGSLLIDEEVRALKANWQRPLSKFPGISEGE